MHDFHYNFIKKSFDAELLFTDTDSLACEIKSEDVYKELFKHKHLFDFSNLSKNSLSFLTMLISFLTMLIKKSKMYSLKNIDGKETNTAKGVSVATEFKKFKDTLFNKKVMRHKMRRIQAKKHELGTYKINKKS